MNFNEYRSWVGQFIIDGQMDEYGKTYVTKKVMEENCRSLNQLVMEHMKKKEYRSLASLAEFLRGEGFFYFDYIDEFGTLIEMMLSQSIAIFDYGEVFNDEYLLWLPRSLYDIIFHQIRLEKYPPSCFNLYFELSKRILDEKYMLLYQTEKLYDSYSQCLYFIDLASHVFVEKKHEFLVLWKMIERQVKEGRGYSWDKNRWPASYAEL